MRGVLAPSPLSLRDGSVCLWVVASLTQPPLHASAFLAVCSTQRRFPRFSAPPPPTRVSLFGGARCFSAAPVSPSATATFVFGWVPHPTALAFLVVRGAVAPPSSASTSLPHNASVFLEVRGASPPPPAVSPASLTARQPFWWCAELHRRPRLSLRVYGFCLWVVATHPTALAFLAVRGALATHSSASPASLTTRQPF